MNRKLSYAEALNEALFQILETFDNSILIGQGITSPWYVGSTTKGLVEKYGTNRIIDSPVSECAITGIATGAAISGSKTIVMHPRMDFMLYAMDPIINHAAKWHYMFGGPLHVPLVIWSIINRGGEQASQHSQAIHSLFAHIPGLKVVLPHTPYDVKGLLYSSVLDGNPVIFVDDRWLYSIIGEVPKDLYTIPIGKGEILKTGSDLTIIANSYLCHLACQASEEAKRYGIMAEVIDIKTIKPLDVNIILQSIRKTRKVLILDGGYRTCGIGAEIASRISESDVVLDLLSPIQILTIPDCPAPAAKSLEKYYYLDADTILNTILSILGLTK